MEPVKRGCKHPGNMPLLGIALWIVISLLHMVPPCTQTLPDPEKGGQKGGSKIGHFGWSDHEGHDLTRSDLEIRRSDLEIARSKSTCRGLSLDLGYPKSDHFGPMESGVWRP